MFRGQISAKTTSTISIVWNFTTQSDGIWILLGIAGLLMVFRFGAPALIFGATGPGPLGNRWFVEGTTATLLLDADLRFFGAMMVGIGLLFFWTIARVEVLGAVIDILACAVALGAAARIYARITYGNPGTAGTIPIVIESVIPILIILLQYYVAQDAKKSAAITNATGPRHSPL
jgi:hypothetical protein